MRSHRRTISFAVSLALAAVLTPAPAALAQESAPTATDCVAGYVSFMEGDIAWFSHCFDVGNGAATVKWFDGNRCTEGCTQTIPRATEPEENEGAAIPFGTYVACYGRSGPIGYDAPGDTDWTCPPL